MGSYRIFNLMSCSTRAAVMAFGLAFVSVVAASAQPTCIDSGTEADINAALVGESDAAVLCPGAVFSLNNPVIFTAPNQQLYTEGLPTDDTRALLQISSDALTNAIAGNNQPGIAIENIQVDGNRSAFGHLNGTALIEIGGAGSDVTVSNIVAYGTRSWSTIHIFEGRITDGVPQCQNANISDNTIGPAGTPDGLWADGISLACGNSIVANNTITDATDGAIVVFGAPGSVIQNNTIIAATQTLLGAINMVDYRPTNGNYTGTLVTNNTIDASSAFIKVGIAMGPAVWTCSPNINFGGTVTNNTLQGMNFGYGYAVNGVMDWTVTDNADFSQHVGTVHGGCGGPPSQPDGYQYESVISSTLQPEFVPARLTYVLGVSPPTLLGIVQPPTGCH